MIEAGWVVTDRYVERRFGNPESVLCSLTRAGEVIDVERFEDGAAAVYDGSEPLDGTDPEPTEPMFATASDVETTAEFSRRGWLRPPTSPGM